MNAPRSPLFALLFAALAFATLVPSVLVPAVRADDRADDRRGPPQEFYPTQPGTKWVMRWTYEDGSEPDVDVIGITGEKVVNGYRKWKVRVVTRAAGDAKTAEHLRALAKPGPDDELFDAWEYYDVDREAYVTRNVDDEDELPYVLLRFPAQTGQTFTDPDGVTTTIVATDQRVTVPAGTFPCIVYEIDYTCGELDTVSLDTVSLVDDAPADEPADEADEDPFDPLITREYWAKGVGLVLVEDYDISSGQRELTAKQQLVHFEKP